MKYLYVGCAILVASVRMEAAEGDADFDTTMMMATIKISHEKSTATGFFIAVNDAEDCYLVTAHHVLNNTPGETTTLMYREKKVRMNTSSCQPY